MLDQQRLGKQRVEAYQIFEVLLGIDSRWKNHPAVAMWRGAEIPLVKYGIAMCNEWKSRGFQDNMRSKFLDLMEDSIFEKVLDIQNSSGIPWWLGNPGFHLSHRSNLLRKAPEHYRQFWPDDPDNLPYVWPEQRDTVLLLTAEQHDWVSWD